MLNTHKNTETAEPPEPTDRQSTNRSSASRQTRVLQHNLSVNGHPQRAGSRPLSAQERTPRPQSDQARQRPFFANPVNCLPNGLQFTSMTLALGLGQCLHAAELSSDRQRADLLAHLLTNLGRETVVKAGIDTRIGNFVAVVLESSPFARHAGSG
jgi:hypothetical protein